MDQMISFIGRVRNHPIFQGLVLIGAVALFVGILRLVTVYIPLATDWEVYFAPTARGWIEDRQILPGEINWDGNATFWNPPWLLWLILPLAVWPAWFGWGIVVVATLMVMIWATRDYEHRWLVFTSPLIIGFIVDGQVEIFPMLGIALGWLAQDRPYLLGIALVLMAAKPQACFLVAIWLLLYHRQRFKALLIPAAVFFGSMLVHGWDWPLRWLSGRTLLTARPIFHDSSPWRSVGYWMVPVALGLVSWTLRLPRTRLHLGAVVAANALITPYMSSHSLVQVLTFSLLPLGLGWGLAGWAVPFTVLLRAWLGQATMHVDFAVAAILMIGYLLQAKPLPWGSFLRAILPIGFRYDSTN
jgi:hypothetical protein